MPTNKIEYKGLGRRKSSVARVCMSPGNGKFTVNKIDLNEYFSNNIFLIQNLQQPLALTNTLKGFNIEVKVTGGGFQGQSGAIRLGISRALVNVNADYKKILKKEKMLTRDSRKKERKKFGKYGARRSPQFTKR